MAKVTLDTLTDIDGFVAVALADGESGLALATQGVVAISILNLQQPAIQK